MDYYRSSIADHRSSIRRGFTLIEVLIATVLIGLAIAALVGANASFTMANSAGSDLSTAEFLAEQIRELTAMLPVSDPDSTSWVSFGPEESSLAEYDDVDDFHGFDSTALGAPIDAKRTPLTDLANFSQVVTVEKVNPSNFDEVWDVTSNSPFVRVTVQVRKNGQPVSSTSWVRARY
jgi:prepilin-type N-terminal cleavage/methylation domain-containing protein